MSGDGYPPEWPAVSLETKIDAGFRCVRCGHPNGRFVPKGVDVAMATLSLATALGMAHGVADPPAPIRTYYVEGGAFLRHHLIPCDDNCTHDPEEPGHRILTVHHLDGVKANLAWWNLAALCQRCHLEIQGRVKMDQMYLHPHSDWFLPYVAGFYAAAIEGLHLERYEVENDLVRLLALGQPHLKDHYAGRLNGGS